MKASIVITTRNRKDDLRRAVESSLSQVGDIEVLVVDDGSEDGTSDMVRSDFPSIRFYRVESSRGYIAARNYAATLASGEIIVSIDDDAEFSSPFTVSQAIDAFSHPRIGAVAIPYVDIAYGPEVKQAAPDTSQIYVTREFRGTAHAVLKSAFIAAGGYRETLVRQCEETDFCIRLLDRGYVTVLADVCPIRHLESPKRNWRNIHLYGRRNEMLVVWWNYPARALPNGFFRSFVNGLRTGRHRKCITTMVFGSLWGITCIPTSANKRKPVSGATFSMWESLSINGHVPFDSIIESLETS